MGTCDQSFSQAFNHCRSLNCSSAWLFGDERSDLYSTTRYIPQKTNTDVRKDTLKHLFPPRKRFVNDFPFAISAQRAFSPLFQEHVRATLIAGDYFGGLAGGADERMPRMLVCEVLGMFFFKREGLSNGLGLCHSKWYFGKNQLDPH